MKIHSFSSTELEKLPLQQYDIAFLGKPVDERGEIAREKIRNLAKSKFILEYNPDEFSLCVNGENYQEDSYSQIGQLIANKKIIIESTSLGVSEIFLIFFIAFEYGGYKDNDRAAIDVIYLQPGKYKYRDESGRINNREFDLSIATPNYQPIPPVVVNLSERRVRKGAIFLGFEGERLRRLILSQGDISNRDNEIIYTLPPFNPGWELNAFNNNYGVCIEENLNDNVGYCAANNFRAAYRKLCKILATLTDKEQMYVVPLSTTPINLAACLFAAENYTQVGMFYDHPKKQASMTESFRNWDFFRIQHC